VVTAEQPVHPAVPPIDGTLRLIVVIYRAFSFVWLAATATSTMLTDDGASDAVVGATLAIAAIFTVTMALVARRREVMVSWPYLIAEGLAAVWIGLSAGLADSVDLFHGGYLLSSLILLVYARPSIAVGGAGILVMSGTQIAVPFLSEVRSFTATDAIGDIAAFLVTTAVFGWGMEALRNSERRRMAAEAELERERIRRERADDRAEIAAHLHDSVLQTLALIQQKAQGDVRNLARRQERDLRTFIDEMSSPHERSVRAELRTVAADIEELHDVRIDLVVTGDRSLDEAGAAAVRAAREALVNAARHSGCDVVSMYAECCEESLVIYVRDRGPGFDPGTVADGRRGVAQSIVGRMARHGGRAEIRTAPGEGTEVEISVGGDTR
jgi:signal transduction histidine kinase